MAASKVDGSLRERTPVDLGNPTVVAGVGVTHLRYTVGRV